MGPATRSRSLTNLDGSSVLVSGGASASFPALTSYSDTLPANLNSQTRTLSASGAGSLLDLHNVATITNGSNYESHLAISASGGGTIDLSGTTSIVDPDTGDERYRAIDVTADGAGSTIDLSALASFTDSYAGSTSAEYRFSTLTAKNSGVIDAGVLATLVGVNVTLDGTGTLPVGQIATLDNSQLTLSGDGASYAFSSLVNLDGSNVLVSGGATRQLPGACQLCRHAAHGPQQPDSHPVSGGRRQPARSAQRRDDHQRVELSDAAWRFRPAAAARST